MNEARNLPINCVVLHSHCRYYVPLRLPPIRNTISPGLYLRTFHGFRPYAQGSASLCSLSRPFLTIRQNSLNVTVCMIARPSYRDYFIHPLSTLYYYNAPSLATRLTGDYRDRTYIGRCVPIVCMAVIQFLLVEILQAQIY